MRFSLRIFIGICCLPVLALTTGADKWSKKTGKQFDLYYTEKDKSFLKDYSQLLANGMATVTAFFDSSYRTKFKVFVHPHRHSLDSTWQLDWNMPSFKSECWMVASGVARRVDMISPQVWDKESCEHSSSNKEKIQQIITHELVHVFHGQRNFSNDFSVTEKADWFIEGLATYVAGQCDSTALASVKELIVTRTYPKTIDIFWEGKLRYGLSGSLVMYIDKNFGRDKLKRMLPFNKKSELLKELGVSEEELLAGWAKFFR